MFLQRLLCLNHLILRSCHVEKPSSLRFLITCNYLNKCTFLKLCIVKSSIPRHKLHNNTFIKTLIIGEIYNNKDVGVKIIIREIYILTI